MANMVEHLATKNKVLSSKPQDHKQMHELKSGLCENLDTTPAAIGEWAQVLDTAAVLG
jgi:hypothetical protein